MRFGNYQLTWPFRLHNFIDRARTTRSSCVPVAIPVSSLISVFDFCEIAHWWAIFASSFASLVGASFRRGAMLFLSVFLLSI